MKINFGEISIEKNEPVTVYDAAAEAGVISRAVLAAKVGGEVRALTYAIDGDADVELLTFADAEGAHVFRHTASHVLAQAVKRLYPETKLTIGPAIEGGFYYDFDSAVSFTPDILAAIESEMKKIVKENLKIERFELPRQEAIAFMTERTSLTRSSLSRSFPPMRSSASTVRVNLLTFAQALTFSQRVLSRRLSLHNARVLIGRATRKTRCFSVFTERRFPQRTS